jgi:hypothetical protein
MRTNASVPTFLLAMIVSNRVPWVIETAVDPVAANDIFLRVMSGSSNTAGNKMSHQLAGGGLRWTVAGDTATCVDGRTAKIPLGRGRVQRIPPAGQQIEFAHTRSSHGRHEYQLIPADMTVVPYMLVFSLSMFAKQFRYFYRRVVKELRGQDANLHVDYPVSLMKVFWWVVLFVAILAVAVS